MVDLLNEMDVETSLYHTKKDSWIVYIRRKTIPLFADRITLWAEKGRRLKRMADRLR